MPWRRRGLAKAGSYIYVYIYIYVIEDLSFCSPGYDMDNSCHTQGVKALWSVDAPLSPPCGCGCGEHTALPCLIVPCLAMPCLDLLFSCLGHALLCLASPCIPYSGRALELGGRNQIDLCIYVYVYMVTLSFARQGAAPSRSLPERTERTCGRAEPTVGTKVMLLGSSDFSVYFLVVFL